MTEVKKLNNKLVEFSYLINDHFDRANFNFDFEQKREGIKINDSIYIIDAQDNISTLSDFISSNGSSIFLRLDISYCNACNNDIILNNIELVEKFDNDNFYIIINYRNKAFLRMMEEKYRNKVKFLYCKKMDIDKDKNQQPFLFNVDSSFIAHNIYVPHQQKNDSDEIYFKYGQR